MYIWILLATIMVALSFYNLTPRSDKDNSFSEIKAATLANRFKIENNAVARLLQCEVLMNLHTTPWDTVKPSPIDLTSNNFDFGYTKPEDNLPVGYQLSNNEEYRSFEIYHYVYCLDKKAEEKGAQIMTPDCQYGSSAHPTYVVSFAKIPFRYLTKNSDRPEPLPSFLKYLADETNGSGVAGWADCVGSESSYTCTLKGRSAYKFSGKTTVKNNANQMIDVRAERAMLPIDSVLYHNPDFADECITDQPCMFMYRQMPTTDKGAYCRHRTQGWASIPPEQRPGWNTEEGQIPFTPFEDEED